MGQAHDLFVGAGTRPSNHYLGGVRYRGCEFDVREIERAESYVVGAELVEGGSPHWRWWEVKVVMEELFRRRIIGWGEYE